MPVEFIKLGQSGTFSSPPPAGPKKTRSEWYVFLPAAGDLWHVQAADLWLQAPPLWFQSESDRRFVAAREANLDSRFVGVGATL